MSGSAAAKFYWQLRTHQTKQLKIVKGWKAYFTGLPLLRFLWHVIMLASGLISLGHCGHSL